MRLVPLGGVADDARPIGRHRGKIDLVQRQHLDGLAIAEQGHVDLASVDEALGKHRLAMLGAITVILFYVVVVLAEFLAYADPTEATLPAYTEAMTNRLLPRLATVMERAAEVPGALVIYHTFETNRPSGMGVGDPRRDA